MHIPHFAELEINYQERLIFLYVFRILPTSSKHENSLGIEFENSTPNSSGNNVLIFGIE